MTPRIGYKQTELGEIPKEWSVKKLSEIVQFKNGINFSKEQKNEKGILTIDVLNMYGENIYIDMNKLYQVNINIKNNDYFLKKDDILFVRSSVKLEGCGWASLFSGWDKPVTFCGFIIRARIYVDNVFPKFLTYFLRSDLTRQKIISVSNQVAITNINQVSLGILAIPLPPLSEQQKIASVLSCIDNAIQNINEIISKTQQLKKGLMQQLLTRGIGHTKFKQTEIGEIPNEWEVLPLSRIVDERNNSIKRGPWGSSLKKSFFVPNGFKIYEQKNVIANNFSLGKYFINEEKFSELKDFEILPGDILISCSGTIGKITIVPENIQKGIMNQALLKLSMKRNLINNKYILNSLQSSSVQRRFFGLSHGSSIQNVVSIKTLKNIMFAIPPLSEQQKISSILTNVDDNIEKNNLYLKQLESLKNGLMQVLLTGKVRVKVN